MPNCAFRRRRPLAATTLENELECDLANTRIASGSNDPKTRARPTTGLSWSTCDTCACARRTQATGCHELRVVEYIEKLSSELEMHTVVNPEFLQECHIPVVDSRTAKETAPRVSELAKLL